MASMLKKVISGTGVHAHSSPWVRKLNLTAEQAEMANLLGYKNGQILDIEKARKVVNQINDELQKKRGSQKNNLKVAQA